MNIYLMMGVGIIVIYLLYKLFATYNTLDIFAGVLIIASLFGIFRIYQYSKEGYYNG